jgi:hypothetical protein
MLWYNIADKTIVQPFQCLLYLFEKVVAGVPGSWNVAHFISGLFVGHDKFNAVKTASLEAQPEIPPARSALAIDELDRQHLDQRDQPATGC